MDSPHKIKQENKHDKLEPDDEYFREIRQETVSEIVRRLQESARKIQIPKGAETLPGSFNINWGKFWYFVSPLDIDGPPASLIRFDINENIYEIISPSRDRWYPREPNTIFRVLGFGGGDVWDPIDERKAMDILKTWGLENAEPGFLTQEDITYPAPVLPQIRMTTDEAIVIYNVMRRSKKHVQDNFRYILEHWSNAGNIVATTSDSVVLDFFNGNRITRLAMLVPELISQFGSWVEVPPQIILAWGSLKRNAIFSNQAINEYQKKVNKIAGFQSLKSSATISLEDWFNPADVKVLFSAMNSLTKSRTRDMVETSAPPGPVTLKNIQRTLEGCSALEEEIFRKLIDNWVRVGGTIQSRKPGQIYLRMKTKAHPSSNCSFYPHNFSLLTISPPHGGKPAYLQVQWDLAKSNSCAYLDCIPDEVAQFEEVVKSLPGFERNNHSTHLWIDKGLQMDHVLRLCEMMEKLILVEHLAL